MNEWLASNWGNLASVAGLVATLVGFIIAISTLNKTRSAAEAAKIAAEAARIQIYKVDIVTVCTDILARFEEIKALHRDQASSLLPSRYSEARSLLIAADTVARRLNLPIPPEFNRALDGLQAFENKIDIFSKKGVEPDFVRFNRDLNVYARGIKVFVEQLKAPVVNEDTNA